MKKRLVSLFVVLTMLCAFVPIIAKAASSGKCGENVTWTLDDAGTLTISGTGDMYDYDWNSPFYFDSSIKKVSIKNGITSIGACLLYHCYSLTSVSIPNSVTYIGHEAFDTCVSLTNISIPNSVTSFGYGTFNGCGLKSVSIPNSVTSIGDYVFEGCGSLTSINIPNSVTSIGDGVFRSCKSLTSISIPNSVTSIGDGVFNVCTSLTNVSIPNSVTSIGDGVFYGCTSLTNVSIPNSVTSIGDEMFRYCSSLTNVSIPNSVTSIEDGMFYGCTSLKSVIIPSGVTFIGRHSFEGCKSLTSINIPNSVTSIGDSAFWGCISLKSVSIPDSVASIERAAFYKCTSLTSISVPNSVTSIEGLAFYGCTSLKNVSISNNVAFIGGGLFSGCSSLTSVNIPNSVTSIENAAFYDCKRLTDVYYEGSEAQWKAINISDRNDYLTNATIHYNSTEFNPIVPTINPIVPTVPPVSTEDVLITVTGASEYRYWNGSIYDSSGSTAYDSIPITVSVKNINDENLQNINIEIERGSSGICFDNGENTITKAISNLEIGGEVSLSANLRLDDFENSTLGMAYTQPVYVYIYDEKGEPLYEYDKFILNIRYLFDMGADNFSFLNTDENFWDASKGEKDKMYISNEAKNKISLIHYMDICAAQKLNNIIGWNGSCFGISSVAATAFANVISSRQLGAETLYNLDAPIDNTLLRDTINILQCSTTTLPRLYDKSFIFTGQEAFRERLVTTLKNAKDSGRLPVLDFKINMGDGKRRNHAVVPFSICENGNNYDIWIYDSNYDKPQKMTIGKGYKSITYKGDRAVSINDIITNTDVLDINTYAPGLLGSYSSSSVELMSEPEYDFTTIIIDTSESITMANGNNQALTVCGDEIIDGDIDVLSIDHIADMDDRYVLIVLNNDSGVNGDIQIHSNDSNKIVAVINNNHNVGFINTEGYSHVASYSSEEGLSVSSMGKLNGDISYSNPALIENTDVFGVQLSGENTSEMGITAANGSVRINADDLSNVNLKAERKDDEYYTTDFSIADTGYSSSDAELSESDNSVTLNIDTDNDGVYDTEYVPVWDISNLENIAAGDNITAAANIETNNCAVILALYDKNGTLLSVSAEKYTDSNEKKKVTLTIPDGIDLTNCSVKAMLWDNIGTMTPLASAAEFPIG